VLVLDAFDAIKKAELEIFVSADASHPRRRIYRQADQGTEDQKDFGKHKYAE